jgi:hypothetical protein
MERKMVEDMLRLNSAMLRTESVRVKRYKKRKKKKKKRRRHR